MISRSLSRRLRDLESRFRPAAEAVVVEIQYVSPDGSEEDGPRFTIPTGSAGLAGGGRCGLAGRPYRVASAERFALLLDLLQEADVDIALPCFFRQQIPKVAYLRLPDAVNSAETLFQSVGVPRQVTVDHQVRPLQVDTFTGCIGGKQDEHILVLLECLLGLRAILAPHAAMNRHQGLRGAQNRAEPFGQIAQCVAMLRKDNELSPVALRIEHLRMVLEK